MNLANQITLFRILIVPVYLFFLYKEFNITATIVFIIASVSDFVDGYLARKYNMITDLGKILDPIADKILVAAAMIALVEMDRMAGWIVIIMLSRDFAVGALRDLSASKGIIIAAGIWGKLKTTIQMVGIGMLSFDYFIFNDLGTILMYVATVLSIYSCYVYFKTYFEGVQ